jgi:hypothetical protein
VVRFGAYEADLRAGDFRKQGMRVWLPEQPFQVLAILLEHPGQVVTREDLPSRTRVTKSTPITRAGSEAPRSRGAYTSRARERLRARGLRAPSSTAIFGFFRRVDMWYKTVPQNW